MKQAFPRQYLVNAFARNADEGNPAAVCLLPHWIADADMQVLAAYNGLSETAFVVPSAAPPRLRWFTPTVEVDLCGHATLATAGVLWHQRLTDLDTLHFDSMSGPLKVRRASQGGSLVLPVRDQHAVSDAQRQRITSILGFSPVDLRQGVDLLVVLEDEQAVLDWAVPSVALLGLESRGIIATAPGRRHDVVCRFFAPRLGLDEDPVTGSAFCQLAPYWCDRLGRSTLQARQCSERGGDVMCSLEGGSVIVTGDVHVIAQLPFPAHWLDKAGLKETA